MFDVSLPEDDLKKVETCRNVNGLYVLVYTYFDTCAFVAIC